MTAEMLAAEASAIEILGASVVAATDIGTHAVEYALAGWRVFPLSGKVPAIRGGRGVLDATADAAQVADWWGGRYAGCNIGGRVPEAMIVIDIDPRHGGADSVAALEDSYGPLPATLTTLSGRGDGGRHLFFRRPGGKLSAKRLGAGVDLKTSSGYVVLPPSIHPDTGKPYERIEHPVAAPPGWLCALLRPGAVTAAPRSARKLHGLYTGPSIADAFTGAASWGDVLGPHGWRCLDADPDADGARWRHPAATSPWSATIRNNILFVYTTSTAFDSTEASNPRGYTKFRAYAVLDHGGDMRAAAKALRNRMEVFQ